MGESTEKCQYLAGYVDLGVFGRKEVYLVKRGDGFVDLTGRFSA